MDVPVFVDFMYSNSSVSLKKEKQQEVNELLLVTVFFILFPCLVSALLLTFLPHNIAFYQPRSQGLIWERGWLFISVFKS